MFRGSRCFLPPTEVILFPDSFGLWKEKKRLGLRVNVGGWCWSPCGGSSFPWGEWRAGGTQPPSRFGRGSGVAPAERQSTAVEPPEPGTLPHGLAACDASAWVFTVGTQVQSDAKLVHFKSDSK